ncbi:unnamed protein product [Malus baccata var. baccata]
MDRIGFLAVFVIIFVVVEVSDATYLLSKHRVLIGEPQNDTTAVPENDKVKEDSPVPSPLLPSTVSRSGGNGSDTKPVDDPSKDKVETPQPTKTTKQIVDQVPKGGLNNQTKKGEGKDPETEKKDPEPDKTLKKDPETEKKKPDTDKVDPQLVHDKSKDDNVTRSVDEGGKKKSKEKEKEKKKNDDVTQLPKEDKESCDGVIKRCEVKGVAIACIKSVDSGSKELAILVQNVGDSTLKAKLSADDANKVLEILKHKNKKVNISVDMGKSTTITLNSGNGECELLMDPLPLASEGNLLMRFPSLETVATPINAAYFLIITVLIFGGTWACCLVRKRKQRTGGGVPYQELEMGLPESVSATAVETAEGWDEGWDDDWDGDNAVKTPGTHLGSISANGLTSRTTNKDGWDNDWDD